MDRLEGTSVGALLNVGEKQGMGWLCKWGCRFWGRVNEAGGCLSLVIQVGGDRFVWGYAGGVDPCRELGKSERGSALLELG